MQRAMSPHALLCQIAVNHGISVEVLKTKSRKSHIARARNEAKHALIDYEGPNGKLSLSQIGSLLNIDRTAIAKFKARKGSNVEYLSHHFSLDDYRSMLRRLTGGSLHYDLAYELDCTAGEAMYLSVLAEHYPRFMSRSLLIDSLTHGMRHFPKASDCVDEETIRPFRARLRKKVMRRALPEPFELCKPDGERLSQEFAQWMHYKFGSPVIYLRKTA